jgi:hypothetical protein
VLLLMGESDKARVSQVQAALSAQNLISLEDRLPQPPGEGGNKPGKRPKPADIPPYSKALVAQVRSRGAGACTC